MMDSVAELFSRCFPNSSTVIRRHNRVAPENAVRPPLGRRGSDPNPAGTFRREELNGEINIHFVGDSADESHVVIECPDLGDYPTTDDHPPESFDRQRRHSFIDPKSTFGSNSYLTTIFIETAKSKTLRVVHYRAIEEDEDEVDDDDGDEHDGTESTDSEDKECHHDDEEYWFSKWSQRTRLKKTAEEQNIEIRIKHAADEKQSNAEWTQKFLGPKVDDVKKQQQDASFSLPPTSVVPSIEITGPENNSETGSTSLPKATSTNDTDEDEVHENSFINLAFEFDENDCGCGSADDDESASDCIDSGIGEVVTNNPECMPDPGVVNEYILESNGKNNYSIPSKPAKPLLFFIHSISGSSDIWKSQINYFHKLGYEIAAVDLLGHGLSGTPPQAKLYHFESLVQDVVVAFDHFVPDEHRQAVVIGHGYGACLATVLTRIRPKNVCILVSMSGGGPTPMVANYWCDFPWIPIPCTLFPKKKKKGRFMNPDLKHVLPRNVMENLILGQIWLDGDPAFHRRITVPTLLVYGLRDKVVNLVEVCEMERTIPRAYLELIPTAGHMVMWDEPRQVNRMIRKFIESKWS